MEAEGILMSEELPTVDVGPTGSPVTKLTRRVEQQSQTYHYPPPMPPEREVYEFDDDGTSHWVKTLTDAEYEEAMARWRTADEQWKKTGGTHMVAGQRTVHVSVECEDGTDAEGIWDGEQVHWTQWKSSEVPK